MVIDQQYIYRISPQLNLPWVFGSIGLFHVRGRTEPLNFPGDENTAPLYRRPLESLGWSDHQGGGVADTVICHLNDYNAALDRSMDGHP